jgi:hypothetical protein
MSPQRIDLPQGTLDLLILRTLALEPQHGWAISERVQQISSDVLQIQQGSLYPPSTASNVEAGLKLAGVPPKTIAAPNTTNSPTAAANNSDPKPPPGAN